MKKIIKGSLIILVTILITGFGETIVDDQKTKNNDRVQVVFQRRMNFDDIVTIKNNLSKKGISINYRVLEFDDNGGLKSMDFIVNCNDGFSGGASNTNIINQSKFGFFRDYTKNAIIPFRAGDLE